MMPSSVLRSAAPSGFAAVTLVISSGFASAKREEIKNLVFELQGRYPDFKERIFGAMQRLPLPEWGPQGRYKRPKDEE